MMYFSVVKFMWVTIKCAPMWADSEAEAFETPRHVVLRDVKRWMWPFCSIRWYIFDRTRGVEK